MSIAAKERPADATVDLDVLERVERRVLWLAMAIVHHANRVRPNPSGVKVGGHQASSASMASIMTALWFAHLEANDQVSVKPHASPVLHAINYLLGRLEPRYLTALRELGGLQSYPSRTKDPDPVDYSTGSVGLGATAPLWGAIAGRIVHERLGAQVSGRQIALIGDAELDEGAIWEAVADPMCARLGEVLWVVDLNRQSLDRVVPDMAYGRLKGMFEAAGWQVITVKYARHLQALFERPGGQALRRAPAPGPPAGAHPRRQVHRPVPRRAARGTAVRGHHRGAGPAAPGAGARAAAAGPPRRRTARPRRCRA